MEYYENDERLGKIPSYSSITFTRVRPIKKSRVETECEFCQSPIHKGESCQYWSGIDWGKFFYYRVCSKCIS